MSFGWWVVRSGGAVEGRALSRARVGHETEPGTTHSHLRDPHGFSRLEGRVPAVPPRLQILAHLLRGRQPQGGDFPHVVRRHEVGAADLLFVFFLWFCFCCCFGSWWVFCEQEEERARSARIPGSPGSKNAFSAGKKRRRKKDKNDDDDEKKNDDDAPDRPASPRALLLCRSAEGCP